MIKFIKKELEIEESLKQRIMIICDFCNTTPTIINGSIRKIDKTNLTYIEPHRIIMFRGRNIIKPPAMRVRAEETMALREK